MRATYFVSIFLLAFSAGAPAQTDEATATTNSPVAYVYVGENTTPARITAFAVHSNGSLVTVGGSPFSGPSQSINVTSGHVFATDGKTIAVYGRLSNGGLVRGASVDGTAHNDTPKDSAVGTLSLDHTASSLYAGEINFQGTDNDAYAVFANQHNGSVTFHANSEISADFGSPLHFSQNNQFVYGLGCFFADWDLFAFHRMADGTLKLFDPGNTVPPNPNNDLLCPSSAAISAKGFLAVTFGIASDGSKQSVLIYRITSSGGLEMISSSVKATNFTRVSARFDPTGTFLAVAGQNGVGIFRLNSNGTLTRMGGLLEPAVAFTDVKWDSTGHVYAISNGALYVFTVHSTGLTLIGSPHPVANAWALAVLPVQ